jgi:HK97 family phage prohead protease
MAGSFDVVREDDKGLYVEASLSNSPSEFMKHVRALVAENHLKTMSMGGYFYRREDRRSIFKVILWEGSLTPIPANPKATFSTRELNADEHQRLASELAA